MKPHPVFDGTLVLDICSEDEKIREAIWLRDGREPQALTIFHHLGMHVDTVLIGPLTVDCIDVRFYNYPYRIEFYDLKHTLATWSRLRLSTIFVRCLTEPVDLKPYESAMLKGKLIW